MVASLLTVGCGAHGGGRDDVTAVPDHESHLDTAADREPAHDGLADAWGGPDAADVPSDEALTDHTDENWELDTAETATDVPDADWKAGPDTPDVPADPCPAFGSPVVLGQVENDALDEVSGLATSRSHPGVLWTHNDSGDTARIFALTEEGKHLGEYALEGAAAVDWEDLSLGPCPATDGDCLYVGDVGDNGGIRPWVTVLIVPEPAVDAGQEPVSAVIGGVVAVDLTYPGGPRDAETLFVDPDTGDVFIVEKVFLGGGSVFRAPSPLIPGGPTQMEIAAEVGLGFATAGDVSPDGTRVLVRNYSSAEVYLRPEGAPLADAFFGVACDAPLAQETQGEAVAFTPDGAGYVTIGEGSHPSVFRVTAP
ncbi:MAG: hypothetical protein FJ098_10735 [Deltaproteobacteria bacterium]|nr:hypothetical protein [Deltaproteobacteria bacterium]